MKADCNSLRQGLFPAAEIYKIWPKLDLFLSLFG